jgi:hypothetical protein
MSTVAGSFEETILLNQRVRADELFGFDSRIALQFTPQYEILNALRAAQTATVQTPLSRRKGVDVEVMWENFCEIVAESCSEDCNVGGAKSSTNLQEYALSFCKEVNFSYEEDDFYSNEFEVNVAKMLLKADKELTEAFAAYAVAQIESFKGTNALTSGKGVVSGTDTYIQAAYWTPAIVAYFNRVGIINQFNSPIFLSGSNLYESAFVAKANAGNADGKGDNALWGMLNPYFDLFNIDTVNTPDLKSYLISMGSVSMAFKNFNPDIPERGFSNIRYTMPARFIPGLTYDVYYNNACNNNKENWLHNYTVKMKADIFLNPAGCSASNTGVLAFTCGAE